MRELDGIRILGPGYSAITQGPGSTLRRLISTADTGDRWSFGEVVAPPDPDIATHLHPGEPEVIIVPGGSSSSMARGCSLGRPGRCHVLSMR